MPRIPGHFNEDIMSQETTKTQFSVVTLDRYIKLHFAGNKVSYAREIGITPQAVGDLVKRGAIIGNGQIYTLARAV